jgi:hypothetical protein
MGDIKSKKVGMVPSCWLRVAKNFDSAGDPGKDGMLDPM